MKKTALLSGVIIIFFLCSLLFFLYWMFTVVTPVVAVEASYQYKKTLSTVFGATNLQGAIIPHFSIGVKKTSKHPEGGIVIPNLFMDEPVVYNIDPNDANAYGEALKHGIAHASATKLPNYGGLGYYFAHSSNASVARQFNAVFYLLGKLKGKEEITLWHEGKSYDYIVKRTKVTTPEDVSFLEPNQYSTETIVLQTCWPPGTNAQRLLVFAERVSK